MKNILKNNIRKTALFALIAIVLITASVVILKGDFLRYGYASDGTKVKTVYEITAGKQHIAYAASEKDAEKIVNTLIKNLEKDLRVETKSNNLKIREMDLELNEHPKVPDIKTAISKADTGKITAESVFSEEDVKYFTTVQKKSSDYKKGVKAISVIGKNGLAKNTYSVKIADNEVKKTTLVSSEVIEKPTNEIVLVGTAEVNKVQNESGGNIADEPEAFRRASDMQYVPCTATGDIKNSETYKQVQGSFKWDGNVLTKSRGAISDGPNGRETYYNLNMSGVVSIMRGMGNNDPYWVRSDGMKMLGNYIMVAANLNIHPRGSIVKCSNGWAIVCDTGGFAKRHPQALDIAVNW